MPTRTGTEFDAAYYRQLFDPDETSWSQFVEVSVNTFQQAKADLEQAAGQGDMDTVSRVRHAIGPSLTQWGAISLETELQRLDASNLTNSWAPLAPEFDALLAALNAL